MWSNSSNLNSYHSYLVGYITLLARSHRVDLLVSEVIWSLETEVGEVRDRQTLISTSCLKSILWAQKMVRSHPNVYQMSNIYNIVPPKTRRRMGSSKILSYVKYLLWRRINLQSVCWYTSTNIQEAALDSFDLFIILVLFPSFMFSPLPGSPYIT